MAEMLQRGALAHMAKGLLEQSAAGGRLLAPVLHLHGPGGWQHLTVNLATPEELRGSLAEARRVSGLESVDAFVCLVADEHVAPLAAGLGVEAGEAQGTGYTAESLAGERAESGGLGELRAALARFLFGRA